MVQCGMPISGREVVHDEPITGCSYTTERSNPVKLVSSFLRGFVCSLLYVYVFVLALGPSSPTNKKSFKQKQPFKMKFQIGKRLSSCICYFCWLIIGKKLPRIDVSGILSHRWPTFWFAKLTE